MMMVVVLGVCLTMVESKVQVPNLCDLAKSASPGKDCSAIRCLRYDPVCGVNGVTYGCGCPEANFYAVRVGKLGAC
ncbi:conserved hypothetical protein [Ricinus communis]|uniref:Kazal-like domain-containing protein n=1 Tax=Ricinus communis TaxID=3988 RepID=B9RMY9_RICCO|nr:conserved hypothetical protein [Ricinus communis]